MEIELKGQRLRVVVNGTEVQGVALNDATAAKPVRGLSRFSGRIGFLKRFGEVRYRNVEVKELAPSKPAPGPTGRPDPQVVSKWSFTGPKGASRTVELYSNGRIDSPNSTETWNQYGNTLVLRWPNAAAPGGVWVDTCTLAADGQSFTGKNQNGAVSRGKKLPDK